MTLIVESLTIISVCHIKSCITYLESNTDEIQEKKNSQIGDMFKS